MSPDSKKSQRVSRRTADSESEREGFLARWSRRKGAARTLAEPANNPAPSLSRQNSGSVSAAQPGPTPAERDDVNIPPLESLTEDSDYSAFFSSKVSEALRKQALRRLFRSAKFNVVDELDDYNEDFRNFEALGDILTADARHQLEVQAKKAREALAEEMSAEEGAEADVAPPVSRDEPAQMKARAEQRGSPEARLRASEERDAPALGEDDPEPA